jgi:hypothetical protein
MVAIAPLLQRIKKSFVHQHSSEGYSTARRSVHYCPQEEFGKFHIHYIALPSP